MEAVTIEVGRKVLQELLTQARLMIGPRVKYFPDNEVFLKGVISEQEDRANKINTIVTGLLYPD